MREADIMDELKEILNEIEELRENLHKLIEKNSEEFGHEIMSTSRMLDAVLNEYYKFLKEKE